MNPVLIGSGLAVGTLVGLTGVGGGSLMTPLLIFFGLDPTLAVGTDLLYSLPTKLFGWHLYRRRGAMRLDIVRPLCIGGVPAAIAGVAILWAAPHFIPAGTIDTYVRRAIGVAVCLSAAMILTAPYILRAHRQAAGAAAPQPAPAGVLVGIGALVGFLVSLTSIGAGAVALPLLALCLPGFSLAERVGADIAFAAILLLVSVAGHWGMRHVDFGVAANLLAGSLPGVFVGSKLSSVLGQRWLRPAIAAVLVLAGARLV